MTTSLKVLSKRFWALSVDDMLQLVHFSNRPAAFNECLASIVPYFVIYIQDCRYDFPQRPARFHIGDSCQQLGKSQRVLNTIASTSAVMRSRSMRGVSREAQAAAHKSRQRIVEHVKNRPPVQFLREQRDQATRRWPSRGKGSHRFCLGTFSYPLVVFPAGPGPGVGHERRDVDHLPTGNGTAQHVRVLAYVDEAPCGLVVSEDEPDLVAWN